MKNTFSDVLIANPGTRLQGDTLTLELRLPWYRALPLSVVQLAELSVNGQPVSLAEARFSLNGQQWPLAALADLTREYWFVLDSAWVEVPVSGLSADQSHQAQLLLKLFPPYIPMLTWVTLGHATLAAQ